MTLISPCRVLKEALKEFLALKKNQALAALDLYHHFPEKLSPSGKQAYPLRKASAFTLLELVLVISIMGIALSLFTFRASPLYLWKQQTALRELAELIPYLHNQSVADRAFYRMEFHFGDPQEPDWYRIGVMRPEGAMDEGLAQISSDAGLLTLELATVLSPSIGEAQTMIPPPNKPSLGEQRILPDGLFIDAIKTVRGEVKEGVAYIQFSPRGFSEFAVIHLTKQNRPFTLLVNPFTGLSKLYEGHQEFEWTYAGGENAA